MTPRFTSSNFAGTSRTEVAVGTPSEVSMFSTMAEPMPRMGLVCGPESADAAGSGVLGSAGVLGASAWTVKRRVLPCCEAASV